MPKMLCVPLGSAILISMAVAWPAAAAPAPAKGGTIRVTTPRGAAIDLLEERPPGLGPFPVVVLAEGSGYDMRQPTLERVAHALVNAGIAVVRFDWAFHVSDPEHGQRSADRIPEIEDLTTVVALVRKAPWADPARIAVGGKSLGSIIAWRVLRREPDLKGALLLTPVCNPKPNTKVAGAPLAPVVGDNYPDPRVETRRAAWILGTSDPACAPAVLYQHLAGAGGAQVDVLRGDHDFIEPAPATAAANERTLDLVTRLATDFATSVLAPPVSAAKTPPRAVE
jgi:dienelactone hydrolase